MGEVAFLRHLPCPSCGSRDANSLYDDGHTYCFACENYEKGDGETTEDSGKPVAPKSVPIIGECTSLITRKIREDTCQHWGYRVGNYNGRPAQFAYYLDPETRKPVACKVRFPNKSFVMLGDGSNAPLYGQWLWRDGGKKVVVTEGEIDALTVSQLQNNKWPVVSIPNGAQGAHQSIKKHLDWLNKFDEVVFMFDMDEPGRAAAKKCAELLRPGKAKIADLPFKDANECLQKGKGDAVIQAMWDAKSYRPDGIISIDDLADSVLDPIEPGLPWCFTGLTDATYGRHLGELITIGAGTGVGKTDLVTQQIAFDATELREKVGVIFLEQPVEETSRRLAGKLAGKFFHKPSDDWTVEELQANLAKLKGKIQLYDHFGEMDWSIIRERIRYLVVSCDCRLIYVDHLTAMADPSREKESIETIMREAASLAQELNCIIHLISHLSTPEGKSHEEGGRVTIKNFKGSRSIGFWSHTMLGMERDQQAATEEARQKTTLRILKHRFFGSVTGKTFTLFYNPLTGRLTEVEAQHDEKAEQEF